MARAVVAVRTARSVDAPLILQLVLAARTSSVPAGAVARSAAAGEEARLEAALTRPDVQVLLAEATQLDGSPPVGVLVLRRGELLPMSGSEAAHVEQLWVHPAHRRRGVARELLRVAATEAQHAGLDDVTCTVPPADRETQRFLARLGFAPLVTRRVVPVATLRRRLAGGPQTGSHRAGLEQLLARRRREPRLPIGGPSPT